MTTIHPSPDSLLIKIIPHEEKTKGGIILMESEDTAGIREGEILAVGLDSESLRTDSIRSSQQVPPLFKVGDRILFKMYNQTQVTVDGQKASFIPYSEVLGTLTRSEV